MERQNHFYYIISNYFNSFRDLQLPKVYRHDKYNASSSGGDDDDGDVDADGLQDAADGLDN